MGLFRMDTQDRHTDRTSAAREMDRTCSDHSKKRRSDSAGTGGPKRASVPKARRRGDGRNVTTIAEAGQQDREKTIRQGRDEATRGDGGSSRREGGRHWWRLRPDQIRSEARGAERPIRAFRTAQDRPRDRPSVSEVFPLPSRSEWIHSPVKARLTASTAFGQCATWFSASKCVQTNNASTASPTKL